MDVVLRSATNFLPNPENGRTAETGGIGNGGSKGRRATTAETAGKGTVDHEPGVIRTTRTADTKGRDSTCHPQPDTKVDR